LLLEGVRRKKGIGDPSSKIEVSSSMPEVVPEARSSEPLSVEVATVEVPVPVAAPVGPWVSAPVVERKKWQPKTAKADVPAPPSNLSTKQDSETSSQAGSPAKLPVAPPLPAAPVVERKKWQPKTAKADVPLASSDVSARQDSVASEPSSQEGGHAAASAELPAASSLPATPVVERKKWQPKASKTEVDTVSQPSQDVSGLEQPPVSPATPQEEESGLVPPSEAVQPLVRKKWNPKGS
jgi:hypothetical protein